MSRRLLSACIGAVLAGSMVIPAFGYSLVVEQRTSDKGTSWVQLYHALAPGHRYRIDVTAKKHISFNGNGFMNYTYTANNSLGEGTRPITLKGTTPKSFTVTQPIKVPFESWLLGMSVHDNSNVRLTVKLVDLGVHK